MGLVRSSGTIPATHTTLLYRCPPLRSDNPNEPVILQFILTHPRIITAAPIATHHNLRFGRAKTNKTAAKPAYITSAYFANIPTALQKSAYAYPCALCLRKKYPI